MNESTSFRQWFCTNAHPHLGLSFFLLLPKITPGILQCGVKANQQYFWSSVACSIAVFRVTGVVNSYLMLNVFLCRVCRVLSDNSSDAESVPCSRSFYFLVEFVLRRFSIVGDVLAEATHVVVNGIRWRGLRLRPVHAMAQLCFDSGTSSGIVSCRRPASYK